MSNSSYDRAREDSYWRRVLRRTVLLLAVWFIAGPVLGVLFVDALNGIRVGGVPLGFWISQQGSIYVFVVLIFLYAWLAERSDRGEERGGQDVAPAASDRG